MKRIRLLGVSHSVAWTITLLFVLSSATSVPAQELPTDRFDDLSPMPGQIKVKTKSPLCHTSVSSWTLAAGAEVTSQQKIERCAKLCGGVVYTVVLALNEYIAGRWTPPVWKPSEQIEHCVGCHGPDTMGHDSDGMNHQQGHMECLMCHDDHTT